MEQQLLMAAENRKDCWHIRKTDVNYLQALSDSIGIDNKRNIIMKTLHGKKNKIEIRKMIVVIMTNE